MLNSDDKSFLRKAMRKFNIPHVRVENSPSKSRWPDIWVTLYPAVPIITVTREWARQDAPNRRSRLVHELLHIGGMMHGRKGNLVFSTFPDRDSYSKSVYRKIVGV